MNDPVAFVFDNTAPSGVSYAAHLQGDDGADVETGKGRPGFRHYLMFLADHSKGFRCVVIHPAIVFLFAHVFKLDLKTCARGRPAGTWRGYPIYIDDTLPPGYGYLAECCGGDRLGTFQVVNV